ncbi:MAG: hypothetical protein CM15mP77_4040 [Synechococcus sp.]|nr:MAG: hypothetical protein CM15mP77_4040 [Synechococcus sp.]
MACSTRLTAEAADLLLCELQLERHWFDFIDLDAFGAPGPLIQPALQALRFDGLLVSGLHGWSLPHRP